MRRTRVIIAAVLVLSVACVGTARADDGENQGEHHDLGRVPSFRDSQERGNWAGRVSGWGPLRYHNGPVMHTNTTYAIYWVPSGYSVASDYRSLIDGFLGDVAADSSKNTNVYYSDTQYYDGAGPVAYTSSFAGSIVDTTPFPASGCSDSVAETSVCLSDAQLQAEIQRVVAGYAWPRGGSTVYFLLTPKGVGSCSGSSCAFSSYCAYHGWIGSGATELLYANQPYTDTVPAACDAAKHPNGSEADPTINVVSHEHNETITDPNGNAWYDLIGYENGDKCAWNFGSVGADGANQTINGHRYLLQQEYSNASRGCVLTGR